MNHHAKQEVRKCRGPAQGAKRVYSWSTADGEESSEPKSGRWAECIVGGLGAVVRRWFSFSVQWEVPGSFSGGNDMTWFVFLKDILALWGGWLVGSRMDTGELSSPSG